ncbi:ATP-binding protein [uncultured Erythrobacter sp.]|uniref:ATP-binding protein n=1 Tax=uncultured Erythrobacter sp. TaxID=263913 RepID=UPI002614769A|nr:ATP-binding protein [uncultured Erythrobacter sp.]
MSITSKIRGLVRWPSRREGISLFLLTVFMVVGVPFEPYDWLQQSISASANSKPYEGDGVVIAIDAETESELPTRVWSKSDLAALLNGIAKHSPKRIVIAKQYFDESNQSGSAELISALAALPQKPAWSIDLAPEDVRELSEDAELVSGGGLADASTWFAPEIAEHVTPAVIVFQERWFAPIYGPYLVKVAHGIVPSAANVLSETKTPPQNAVFPIDLSYDPKTVPTISAADVLNGEIAASQIRGKNIVIGFTDVLGRDTRATPQDAYTSNAALTILASQTLIDGPPLALDWVPSFVLALVAVLLWLVLRRPYGRWIALTTLFVIALSPFFLERFLIFQGTSQGVFLILIVGTAKFWQRGREAVQIYRSAAEAKSQFLAQASHDLRQPIHAIGLLADRLSQSDLSAEQQEIVTKISWSVDSARRMFRALLDIAAIESGTLQKEESSVSVNELLAELDSQNALAAEQANVVLRLVPSDMVVKTDRALIGTMLQNLVSNAIRYSPGGRIVVGCRRKVSGISFWVVDNGRGISADEMENVQKEFYRSAKRSNLSTVNKGLGLAIVNRLADILGLRFDLQSKLGKGTKASINGLQVIRVATSLDVASTDLKLPLAGLRVVLADDDQETLDSTTEVLQKWGCEISAYSELPAKIPTCDIVLSDFDFGFGGTLADRGNVVSTIDVLGAKLIVVSGHHPEQIREHMPDHEGLILTKPLRAAQLRSALMSLRTSNSDA